MAGQRMKIAITGTHNVGKTSLAHSLVGYLKERGIHATVNAEIVRNCPIPTGTEKNNSVDSQIWIMGKQLIDEIELSKKYPVIVCDRSILCNYAYFLWTLRQDPSKKDTPGVRIVNKIFEEWIETYDYIFRLPPSHQTMLANDGFRSVTDEWQREIDAIIDKIIEGTGIKTYTIPLDKNEKRVQKIIDILRPKFKELQIG